MFFKVCSAPVVYEQIIRICAKYSTLESIAEFFKTFYLPSIFMSMNIRASFVSKRFDDAKELVQFVIVVGGFFHQAHIVQLGQHPNSPRHVACEGGVLKHVPVGGCGGEVPTHSVVQQVPEVHGVEELSTGRQGVSGVRLHTARVVPLLGPEEVQSGRHPRGGLAEHGPLRAVASEVVVVPEGFHEGSLDTLGSEVAHDDVGVFQIYTLHAI